MIALAFFSWWYGRGWNDTAHRLSLRIDKLNRAFSVRLLLKTLFSPWRRIITYPGASIGEHFRAWGDNVVSRIVGFMVRIIVLLAALVAALAIVVLSFIEIVVWPLLPPAIPVLIILGVIR